MRNTDPYPIKSICRQRSLRDDPQYDELKKILEEFPPEKMEKLKMIIKSWGCRH
jgi:hypothetical protein